MRLLDQQYFNTPFYGCQETFWLKELGYKVNRRSKTFDENHQLANHL
jgi:hypothetical protein